MPFSQKKANLEGISYEMYLLLVAYTHGCNKDQARDAIAQYAKKLSLGRCIYPLTQKLLDRGFVEKIERKEKGIFSQTTEEGMKVISDYQKRIALIATFQRRNGLIYLEDCQQL
jgi:DNA-binding PadR family transcriptional regulator